MSRGRIAILIFLFVMECDFEYPKGPFIRCNDWCVDLW